MNLNCLTFVTLVSHNLDPARVVTDDQTGRGLLSTDVTPLAVVPAKSHHAARLGQVSQALDPHF